MGRYPVSLACSHAYNWSTLTAKKPNGEWALVKCVVPGCLGAKGRPGTAPETLEGRRKLKEHARIKHLLQVSGTPAAAKHRGRPFF